MNVRHYFNAISLIGVLLFFSKISNSQNLYFNDFSESKFVDRLHTMYGHNGDTFLVNTPLSSMADAFNLYNFYKTDVYNGVLTNKDIYKINQKLIYNSDLSSGVVDPLITNVQYTGTLGMYINSPFLLEKKGHFNFLLQPVIAQTAIYDISKSKTGLYIQTHAGLYTRMTIGKRFGLQAQVIFGNEQLMPHFNRYYHEYSAVPGYIESSFGQMYKINNKIGISAIIPTGQIVYDIVPNHLSITAGFDNLFIGEGVRSLILGRSNAPLPFVALKTKFWKFDYTNIFLKPNSQTLYSPDLPQTDQNKYVSIHYLSANIGKRFNVGFFETITSSRANGPEMSYFNPVIFYRAAERHLGSPDKMAIGMTGSAIITKGLKAYGQVFINEFVVKELLANDGFIHNKWGAQLGVKYYNVASVDNLDAQVEMNVVRPYAYQHRSNSNYSHSNMPLAHPLGANFKEYLFNLSYSPHVKFFISGRLQHYVAGKDINNQNYGGHILKDIRYHPNRHGVNMIHGRAFHVTGAELSVRYEVLPHLYIELGGLYRQERFEDTDKSKSMYGFGSVQFHLNRRDLMLF